MKGRRDFLRLLYWREIVMKKKGCGGRFIRKEGERDRRRLDFGRKEDRDSTEVCLPRSRDR